MLATLLLWPLYSIYSDPGLVLWAVGPLYKPISDLSIRITLRFSNMTFVLWVSKWVLVTCTITKKVCGEAGTCSLSVCLSILCLNRIALLLKFLTCIDYYSEGSILHRLCTECSMLHRLYSKSSMLHRLYSRGSMLHRPCIEGSILHRLCMEGSNLDWLYSEVYIVCRAHKAAKGRQGWEEEIGLHVADSSLVNFLNLLIFHSLKKKKKTIYRVSSVLQELL